MKITHIARIDNIFQVTFTPNWLQRLFGVKEKLVHYKDTGHVYGIGNGHFYLCEDGKLIDNIDPVGEAIDNWRRKF
jgi:hypothetical protein